MASQFNETAESENNDQDVVAVDATSLDIVGPLTVNSLVTWTAMDSPVRITGIVDIATGGVLTVSEGVEVLFQDSTSGITNSGGTLSILGQSSNRATLRAEGDFSWQGITFGAQAIPGSFNADEETSEFSFSAGSVIQYTDIKFAGSSSFPALDFRSGSTPFLLGVDLVECVGPSGYSLYVQQLQGIFVSKFLRLAQNNMDSSFKPSNAFRVQGSSTSNGIVVLEDMDVTAVTSDALYVNSVSRLILRDSVLQGFVELRSIRQVTCTGNTMSSTRAGTVLDANYLGSTSEAYPQLFQDNTITAFEGSISSAMNAYYWYRVTNATAIVGNTLINGRLDFSYSSYATPVSITGNTVRDSRYGGMYFQSAGGQDSDDSRLVVADNVIEDCDSPGYSTLALDVRFNSLQFSGNRISRCVGLRLLWLDGTSDYENQHFVFEENTVEDSQASDEMILFYNYPLTSFQRNVFENCTATVSIRLDPSRFTSTDDLVVLPMNYWGVFQDDITGLRLTVRDGFTSSVTSVILFETVLVAPSILLP